MTKRHTERYNKIDPANSNPVSCRAQSLTRCPLDQAIKGLREKLDETRASFAPRARFTFKTVRKNPSAVSLSDAAELAAQKRRNPPGHYTASSESSFATSPNYVQTPDRSTSPASVRAPPPTAVDEDFKDPSANGNKEHASLDPRMAPIRRPTFSASSTVSITRESNAHIILPSSTTHASKPCSLTSVRGCVVDLSALSPQSSAPFAALTIKNAKASLLVCGVVNGPAHITAVEDSVLVMTCRQFRMHECRNVDVYLSCSSHPIIEDCSGIRFAPLPDTYVSDPFSFPNFSQRTNKLSRETVIDRPADCIIQRIARPWSSSALQDSNTSASDSDPTTQSLSSSTEPDLWSQVDDFKWLKQEASPNWSLLPPEDIVADEAWREVVPGGPGWSLDDILRAVKVIK